MAVSDVVQRLERETGGAVTVDEICDGADPQQCARAALARGATIVIAAGGDGTVSAVATALIGTTARLGVLPLGTSNSFGAALGIPGDLDGAFAMLARGETRTIDIAVVRSASQQRAMIMHCMVGFHADVIEQTATDAKQRWGVLAYAASALRQLANLETFAVELDTGAHVVKCRAIAVAAANIAPIKTVLAQGPSHLLGDDGRIDITIVAADSIAEVIATGVHLYRQAREGEPATRDNVGSFSASRVAITADPPQRVLVDGEAFGDTPIIIETIARALTVLAPPAPETAGPQVEASLTGLPELEIDGRRR